jgi:hypothetical protein
VSGWYGEDLSRVTGSLAMQRRAGNSAALIFIPLLASLLIPLLAIWMNRVEEGEFQIEAFELANVIVGGLFAVIALNFTLNAEYATLGSSDNTVRRLFALNYLALALSLLVNLTLFRFNLPLRWFGRYVQEQVFLFLSWRPLLVLATAVAFCWSRWRLRGKVFKGISGAGPDISLVLKRLRRCYGEYQIGRQVHSAESFSLVV